MEIVTKSDAKERGLKTYFTGKKCKHGHLAERFVSNSVCTECHKVRERDRFEANKEVILARQSVYRRENPDKIREKSERYRPRQRRLQRQRYWADPESARAKKRAEAARYWRNNPHAKSRYDRWVEENLEYLQRYRRKWRSENYEKVAANRANRRAAKINATPSWADLEAIREIYNEAITLRSDTGRDLHVDHIVPLVSDRVCGLHVPENLRIIEACDNISKGNYWPSPEASLKERRDFYQSVC